MGSPEAGQIPQPSIYGQAVKLLTEAERLEVLRACAARYEAESASNRVASGMWVTQVLEQGGASLAGRPELREALRPLLGSVSKCLGSKRRHTEILSCLGSWRLVGELAAAQREATEATSTTVDEASRLLHDAKKQRK